MAGNLIGEIGYLLAEPPNAEVIIESDDALVVRFPSAEIQKTLDENPLLAGKFYCFLATRQAAKLRRLTSQEQVQLSLPDGIVAPRTISDIAANGAFLLILHKFIESSAQRDVLAPLIELVHEVRHLHRETDPDVLPDVVKSIYNTYAAPGAPTPATALADDMRSLMAAAAGPAPEQVLKTAGLEPGMMWTVASAWRHVYDDVMEACLREIESRCLSQFISSTHYAYVLSLKAKELTFLSVGHFKVQRLLGEGGFGQVLEVVKRDCGKRYAMKVMSKDKVMATLGEDNWEELVMVERKLLAKLQHPLLINLAYSFQNVSFLVLVMDACPGGDLAEYGVEGDGRLTATQVKFVALEATAVITYLHSMYIMFRDIKPANMLLDDSGHVRLIDFGIAEEGDREKGVEPTSNVECGSGVYVAPEIRSTLSTGVPYNCMCDWFSLGVMVYELMEKSFPFGLEPAYEDLEEEYIQPELIGEDGEEVPDLFDMLAGLLDWDPSTRLGGEELKVHPYWTQASTGEPADWELVEQRRLPSPLVQLVQSRVLAKRAAEKASNEDGKWSRHRMSVGTSNFAKELSLAAAAQAKVDAINKLEVEGDKNDPSFKDEGSFVSKSFTNKELDDLVARENEMRVENYEFSSPHAISREYMENHHDVVSVL